MANYLERVAAAGARVGPQALPAVAAPPNLPGVPQLPLGNSLPESSSSDGFIITPTTTPQRAISPVPASLSYSASPDQSSAEMTIAQQLGPEIEHQNYDLSATSSLSPPSDAPVYAPKSSHQAQSAAKPGLHIESIHLIQPPLANSLAESSSGDGFTVTQATTPPDQPSAEVTIAQRFGPEANHQNSGRPDTPSLSRPSDTPVCAPQSAAKPGLHIEPIHLIQPPLANSLAESSSSDGFTVTPATTPPDQPSAREAVLAECRSRIAPAQRVECAHEALPHSAYEEKHPARQVGDAEGAIAQRLGPEADHQNSGRPDTPSLSRPSVTPVCAPRSSHEAQSAAMPALHIEPTHLMVGLPGEIADPTRHAARSLTPSPPIESAPHDMAHAANEGSGPQARVRQREHKPVANPTAPVARSRHTAKVTSLPLSNNPLTPHNTPTRILEQLPTVKVIAPQPGPSATKRVDRLPVTPSKVESSGTPLCVAKSLSNTERPTTLMSESAPPHRPRFPEILPSQPAQVQPASMATTAPPALSEPAPEASPLRRQPAVTPPDASLLQRPPQACETPHTPRPGVNPPVRAALPRPNHVDHVAPLPLSTGHASARKNATRISIGRIEVQVVNHPQSVAAPRLVGRLAPQEINLESRFLTRFLIRP